MCEMPATAIHAHKRNQSAVKSLSVCTIQLGELNCGWEEEGEGSGCCDWLCHLRDEMLLSGAKEQSAPVQIFVVWGTQSQERYTIVLGSFIYIVPLPVFKLFSETDHKGSLSREEPTVNS